MNPHHPRPAVFTERVRQKNWQQLWPQLQICWPMRSTDQFKKAAAAVGKTALRQGKCLKV